MLVQILLGVAESSWIPVSVIALDWAHLLGTGTAAHTSAPRQTLGGVPPAVVGFTQPAHNQDHPQEGAGVSILLLPPRLASPLMSTSSLRLLQQGETCRAQLLSGSAAAPLLARPHPSRQARHAGELTLMGAPVLDTPCPRTSPSVVSMAMVRTVFSPMWLATSSTTLTSWSSTSRALLMCGSSPSNCTSTTAPITCTREGAEGRQFAQAGHS